MSCAKWLGEKKYFEKLCQVMERKMVENLG
jgi:hypothetical protein